MIKIINYIQWKLYLIISYIKWLGYFIFRLLIENNILKKMFNNIKDLYFWILLFFLVFFYFYVSIKFFINWYFVFNFETLSSKFIDIIAVNIELYHKTSVVLLFIIFLSYFKKISDFTQKYLINWTIFLLLLWINLAIFLNTWKNFAYDFFVLNYIGLISLSFLWFWIIASEVKAILNIDKQNSNKAYYINSYKKIYNKTYKNKYNNFNNTEEYVTLKYEHYKDYIEEAKKFNNIEKNYIKPINDDPITLWWDIFWYDNFSKSIYDIISWINTKDLKWSYSIWIVWEWGLWKSSIINLLYEDYIDGRNNFIFYKFNPWNYTKENILEKFLTDFSKNLDNKIFSKQILSYLSLLSEINWNFKILTSFLNNFFKDKTLNDIKNDINDYLWNLDKKIIIVIDDLDRCEPDEVIMMLNIIKNLWDFKNVIYLVSYDKKHIIEVLEKKWFEWIYIDKIINIEKYIIKPTSKQLEEYFFKEFENILWNINYKFNSDEVKQVIKENIIIFSTENLRFIKKILNHINLVLQLDDNKTKVLNFSVNDFSKLVLVNYIKLKDYVFFVNSLNIAISIELKNVYKENYTLLSDKIIEEYRQSFIKTLWIEAPLDKTSWIISIKSSYSNFPSWLNWLKSTMKSLENDKESQWYKRAEKQYLEEKAKYEKLKENIDFIKEFS